jgi:hypothetical protein
MAPKDTRSARIRSRLSHPIIDSDGHWIEYDPVAMEYLEKAGGRTLVESYKKVAAPFGALARMPLAARRDKRV